jgi:hypothetical protein
VTFSGILVGSLLFLQATIMGCTVLILFVMFCTMDFQGIIFNSSENSFVLVLQRMASLKSILLF